MNGHFFFTGYAIIKYSVRHTARKFTKVNHAIRYMNEVAIRGTLFAIVNQVKHQIPILARVDDETFFGSDRQIVKRRHKSYIWIPDYEPN